MTPLPPAARSLARLAVGWTALSELVPLYPLYALLFLDTGLSATDVSLLFAAWSLTAVLTEVPAGALADRWSRRGVLVVAGVLEAVDRHRVAPVVGRVPGDAFGNRCPARHDRDVAREPAHAPRLG